MQNLPVFPILLLILPVGLVSCAHVNEPLNHWTPSSGYRDQVLTNVRASDRTQLALSFSGGGTRAAAMAYGVLEELAQTQVTIDGVTHRLLDEVDAVSGVSGGSFTASYFALYGDRIFEDYEQRFLKRNVQRALIFRMFWPWNFLRLLSPYFSRSDLAIEYYHDEIFDGATFETLQARDGPKLRINATDLSTGVPFRFNQDQFDFICSDLSSFPVARAVGASAAVPFLFPPVTLRNYAGECGFGQPAWLKKSLNRAQGGSARRSRYARVLNSYLDSALRPYIHLIDGGVSDNLAIRNPIATAASDLKSLDEHPQARTIQRFIGIIVNAQTETKLTWSLIDRDPSVGAILAFMTNSQIDVLSDETIELLHTLVALWREQASAAGLPTKFYLVEVDLQSVEDEAEREYLNHIPTTLSLPEEAVDRLRQAARRLLRTNPDFQRLLKDLAGEQIVAPHADE